jgi:solute carrier family 10 (sodium/bile acid cotransporter), member 7
MSRLLPDRFVMLLFAALALAWVLPLRNYALSIAQGAIYAGIFLLFFLHGLRLPRGEVMQAARQWRLQAAMLGFCFAAMPLAGWAIAALAKSAMPGFLLAGIVYLAVLPSTVQSSISYTAIGGGNVAASVVGAALSNLAGIVLTPLLVTFLLGTVSTVTDGNTVIRIACVLLLPFALGQIAQRWLSDWARNRRSLLSFFDRAIILLAVYIAFSGAIATAAFAQFDLQAITALILALLLLLAFAFGGALLLGGVLGMPRADGISLMFAGAHKSIATGAPMAALLFGNSAGLIILPAILYHMAQLVISAPLAARMARKAQS